MNQIIEDLERFGVYVDVDNSIVTGSGYMTADNVMEYIKVKYPNEYLLLKKRCS